MHSRPTWRLWHPAFPVLFLGLTALIGAAQEPALMPEKSSDQQLSAALRDVINRGRDFYNNGNPAACYFMFHGALLVAKPTLESRPELQKMIQDGIVQADANPDMRQRAWMLRNVLDRVRTGLRAEAAVVAPKPKEKMPDEAKPAEPKPAEKVEAKPAEAKPAEKTLWLRLGGEPAVTKVVDDFVALAAEDAKVNFTRDGKYKPNEEQMAALKKSLIAFVSQATGGPIKYTGKSMKEVHKDMGITDAEFDAAAADLGKALEKNEVKEEDMKALLAIVETTRKDIVTKKE